MLRVFVFALIIITSCNPTEEPALPVGPAKPIESVNPEKPDTVVVSFDPDAPDPNNPVDSLSLVHQKWLGDYVGYKAHIYRYHGITTRDTIFNDTLSVKRFVVEPDHNIPFVYIILGNPSMEYLQFYRTQSFSDFLEEKVIIYMYSEHYKSYRLTLDYIKKEVTTLYLYDGTLLLGPYDEWTG
ncbi:MAG TPA: hypothetical protein VMZ69_04850 [Saprospiraceae bacterium]|nr:hypothetical protein [Saprospiraceae bacterium]